MKSIDEFRSEHSGKVCLFWRGGVYESYDADASVISRVCGSPLKPIHCENKLRQMTEFPGRYFKDYLERLEASGHRVAILERIEPRIP